VEGRIKISDFSKEQEIVVSSVSGIDARQEAERILEGIGA
jgi:hypothetical protein